MACTRAVVALITLVVLVQPAPANAQAARRAAHILLLYSHDPKTPGAVAFARELTEVLHREWPAHVEIYEEYIDFDRLGDRTNWPRFSTYLADKYRGFRLDATVAEGSVAVQFATERLRSVFPRTPIVYGNAFEPVIDFTTLPANVTGRRIPLPFAATFALAHSLLPSAKRVVLVSGASALDTVMSAHAVHDITPLLHGMQLEMLVNWTYPTLLRSLHDLHDSTFVLLSSIRKDWSGQAFTTGDMIPSIVHASSVPVFGIARNWVGDGIVGGAGMQFAAEGEQTGRLLMRVLAREGGARLPPAEIAVNPLVVDWRQLQQWKLSEALLPKDTEVLFRTPSAWERYRPVILLIVAITLAQSALIALLLLERRARIHAQRSVDAQMVYEQMLAALRVDLAEHATDESSRALQHAIAHIGRYAAAMSAKLEVHAEDADQPSTIFRWSRAEGMSPSLFGVDMGATPLLTLPLVSEGTVLGTLTLRSLAIECGPHSLERKRLQSAVEVITLTLTRARASRALAESRGHVAYLARNATMGQLSAAVTHELRQPLMAIRYNAETGARLLEQEPPDVVEVRAVLHDIADDNTRAMEVTEHVRLLLQKQKGASASVSINDICVNAAKFLQRDAQAKGVAIRFSLAEALPSVHGDAVQLQQVALNLVMNAIESSATSTRERSVVLFTAMRTHGVELEVRDSGPGLPPQVQRHLFESYFSTKTSGLGMGLAIVRQIVEAHNGEVRAENCAGGGALFRVTFPTEVSVADSVAEAPEGVLRGHASVNG